MGEAIAHTAKCLEMACEPVFIKLIGVSSGVAKAEGKLRKTLHWFSWRWAGLVFGSLGTMLLAFWFASMGYVEWQRFQLDRLISQREDLRNEIIALSNNVASWKKFDTSSKIIPCGEEKRACVRVNTDEAYYDGADIYYPLRYD